MWSSEAQARLLHRFLSFETSFSIMAITYDVIWGFKEDILEVRGRFKEHVWLAHLSQPMGIPLHKYKGKVTLNEHKIAFSGKDKDTQQPSEFTIPRQKILEPYLDWDDVLRRWKDTRAWIKPLRITFKTDEEPGFCIYTLKRKAHLCMEERIGNCTRS